jgi:hypothetical protein
MTAETTELVSGFDAPVEAPTADMLARGAFSKKVYDLLCPTDNRFSVRVGLTGEWGSGKTSVAKWVNAYAKADGHEVVWFNPWAITTTDQLWLSFYQTLRGSLKLPEPENTRGKISEWWRNSVNELRKPAETLSRASAVTGAITATILDFAKITPDEIGRLRDRIGNKRVIVVIDDLDRADPALLAKLLLSLRELFDIAGFSFLIPFDMKVVSEALVTHHPAWKSGDQFLEKILDYRVSIPELDRASKVQLFTQTIREFAPDFRLELVEDALDWLPNNPRRIKALARIIQPIGGELARHNADEIDWRTVLFAALARAESGEFFELLTTMLFDAKQREARSLLLGNERLEERSKILRTALEKIELDTAKNDRLSDVCGAWLSAKQLNWSHRAAYAVQVFDASEGITWKEFEEVINIWSRSKNIEEVLEHLSKAPESKGSPSTSMPEFVAACGNQYGNLLDRASNTNLLSDHEQLVSRAAELLQVIEAMFFAIDNSELRLGLFRKLVEAARVWPNFTVNPGDAKIRVEEISLLDAMIANAGAAWEAYGEIVLDLGEASAFGVSPAFTKLVPSLRHFDQAAVSALDSAMRSNYGINRLLDAEGRHLVQAMLLDPTSPAWTPPGQSRLEQILTTAPNDPVVQKNAYLLLNRIFSSNLPHVEHGKLADKLVKEHRIIAAVWTACTAQQYQHRMLEGLRDMRNGLIGRGVPDSLMPEPAWLTIP